MNDKIEKEVQILPPFKKFCMTIGELPSSYLETMTYYEMLVWFCNYLGKTVIPTIDNNAEAVIELQNLFVELQTYVNDYFDNLDVQEEINNKLDDMVEAGTLQEIIADYLNSKAVFGFDTVALMKSSTNLIDGSYARTLGYYSINDGGSGLYKIREITNSDVIDEGSIIAIGTGDLIAELIPENNSATPNQFGAYGDGTHDDITALNKCKNYCITNKITFKGVSKSIYGISEGFTIETGTSFDFDLATVKALNTMQYVIRQHKEISTHVDPVDNDYTKNIVIDCDDKANYGFYQDILGWSILTDNIRVLNPLQIGIYIKVGQIRLYNSKVENLTLPKTCIGLQVDSSDSEYYNIVIRDCTTAVKVTSSHNTFNEIHPALFNNTREGSRAFEISDANEFINCYADTFQYGIVSTSVNGFSAVNLRCVCDPEYYNDETNPVTKGPEAIHFDSTDISITSRVSIFGTFLDNRQVYGTEYMKFSNIEKWSGSSIRLNNPKLNNDHFTVPKEIRQNTMQISLSNYVSQNVTITTSRCITNGNCSIFQLANVVLPNVTADGIQYLCENIPSYYLGEQTIEKYITSKNGVVCLLQFRTNGGISIKPLAQITAGDVLNIYEIILK